MYWSLRKRRFFYPGRKDTIKAAIYVKDLVHFFQDRLKEQTGGTYTYNCTYEPTFTIEEIVETMAKVTSVKAPKLKINASLMLIASSIIGMMGGRKLGIHPDRVKKLMISTNISGKEMKESGYIFKYSLDDAIKDWYADNDNQYFK